MHQRTLLLPLLVFFAFPLAAQSSTDSVETVNYLIETSRKVDPDRYRDVRGTPYRYDDFGPITAYDQTLNPFPLKRGNYNAFSQQFEYYADGVILRELSGENFIRVDVPQPDGSTHTYARGINFKYPDKYAQIVHRGENITGTMVYDVENQEKIVQDVGKTLKLRRFQPQSRHYAIVHGEMVQLKLNAKKLAADLGQGHKADLTRFIKANKLKPNRLGDLVKIYAEAERLHGE